MYLIFIHSHAYIGGWGGESFVTPTGKSFRFVRACERARRGEAAWASERRFDSGARAVLGQKESYCCYSSAETVPEGCPRVF